MSVYNPAAVELRPFRSIRYSRATIAERGLASLIAPPSDADAAAAIAAAPPAPGNIARLLSAEDPEAAAATLKNWLAGGILDRERRPGLWSYRQTFVHEGATLVRDALVGLVRLEGAGKGSLLRVEEPDPARREKALALVTSLRADFTPALFLTRAPLSGRLATTRRPDLTALDSSGVRHDAYRITDFAAHVELQGLAKNVEAILAEGENLFEAAVEYSKDPAAAKFSGAKYKLCAILDAESPGLVVRPVHRLLFGLPDWNPGHLIYAASDFFETREFSTAGEARTALEEVSRLRPAFVLVALPEKPTLFVLRDRPDALPWPAERSEAWRNLDTASLDVALFSRLLGTDEQTLAREGNVFFTSDAEAAVSAVEKHEAQAALLMRPMTFSEIETIAHAGERLPRRAASFHPKAFAGLFGFSLEDPVY
ncbi:MAG TPA: DUF1015 family protein [Thermoanaerobaculia bacterium]